MNNGTNARDVVRFVDCNESLTPINDPDWVHNTDECLFEGDLEVTEDGRHRLWTCPQCNTDHVDDYDPAELRDHTE